MITNNMVPIIDGTMGHKIETRKHPRHRTQCVIQYPTNIHTAQSLQENAITVFGPRVYNSMPKYLRDIKSVEKVLNIQILISPKCPTMTLQKEATASSTIYLILGLKEFTKVVESPTRPRSRLRNHSKYPKQYK